MRHEEQIRVLKQLMHHLDAETNVDAGCQVKNPVSSYTSHKLAELEWQNFFQDYPHVLGLSSDLPERGSFFTNDDLGKPILCTRDLDGNFRAFLNICRHRGVVVEKAERGRKKKFSCPFHSWTYSAKGDLLSVPMEEHFGKVNKSCNSLISLPATERYGVLWVSPNPKGTVNVDELMGDLGEELAHWDFAGCQRFSAATYPHASNWKLANDTFGETYHLPALHRATLAMNFHGNVQTFDTYKRNHRITVCLHDIDKMREMPTGKWNILRGAIPLYYLFPNTQLLVTTGGPILIRIYPDKGNPNNSRSEITWYTFSDEVYRTIGVTDEEQNSTFPLTKRMEALGAVIEAEDYVIAASAQIGALSGAQDHVIFGRNEPALHHYHANFREALGLPPLEIVDPPVSTAAD